MNSNCELLGGRACRLTASKAIYSSLLTVVILVAVSLAVFMFTTAALGQQTQSDAPADAQHNSAQLAERSLYRRAVEAVIWGMPAVNAKLGHFATPFNEGTHWALPADSDVLEGLQTKIISRVQEAKNRLAVLSQCRCQTL